MTSQRPGLCPASVCLLQERGLRPTRQRVALARLLFRDCGCHRHVTAEQLYAEAVAADVPVSLATVYNTLNQFTEAGLLREVVVEPGRSYYDTNVEDHHHFFHEASNQLIDIDSRQVVVANLPTPPKGCRIARVDVVVRLTDEA